MRLHKLLPTLALFAVIPEFAEAREPAREVFLSEAGGSHSVSAGEHRTFFVKIPAAQSITFDLAAENEVCGYEIRKTSQLGFLPAQGRFPLKLTDSAQAGEVYTISFFQNRAAWIAKAPCHFSFSVN